MLTEISGLTGLLRKNSRLFRVSASEKRLFFVM